VKVLVAGIGNIFLGDDGFGSEVARRLGDAALPPGVEVVDFGIRGVHLAYQLLDGYDGLVIIDAIRQGDPPGTISLIEPELGDGNQGEGDGALRPGVAVDAHGMDPESVLRSLSALGGSVARVLVVGCEPLSLEEGIGLSEPVDAALDRAAEVTLDAVTELLSQQPEPARQAVRQGG
jgi:hydrogenase maturation protease